MNKAHEFFMSFLDPGLKFDYQDLQAQKSLVKLGNFVINLGKLMIKLR